MKIREPLGGAPGFVQMVGAGRAASVVTCLGAASSAAEILQTIMRPNRVLHMFNVSKANPSGALLLSGSSLLGIRLGA